MADSRFIQFIRANIPHIHPSPDGLAGIAEAFEQVVFDKGEYLLRAGKVSGYFVLTEGVMRAYSHSDEGAEVTTNFYTGPRVVFEPGSFFLRQPSQTNIVALSHCAGYLTNFTTLNGLFHQSPEFREFGRAILVKELVLLQQQKLSFSLEAAEKRYLQLMEESPDVFRHAALKHIASYLGVTDTSLSRIRRELSKK